MPRKRVPPRDRPLAAYSYSTYFQAHPAMTGDDLDNLTYDVHRDAAITRVDVAEVLGFSHSHASYICNQGGNYHLRDEDVLMVLNLYMERLAHAYYEASWVCSEASDACLTPPEGIPRCILVSTASV